MFQTPVTIAEAISNIEHGKYLLPSIQREFEWGHEKIEWLFDSIMRNYPISSFLFWRVEGSTKTDFKFYGFLRDYRERYKTHNEERNTQGVNDFTAVLDGQQRLTSLYIGLRGSYAYRKPRVWEENSEKVYPTRHLYLNILSPLKNEEDGRIYEFKFLTESEYKKDTEKWFKVADIYGLSDDFEFNKYLDERELKKNEFSYRSLSTLKNIIHSKQIINFFLETEQDIDKALNIFIRINSGGEPLNFSDLLMSIAVANWEKRDARKEIHALVDEIRDKGFFISKDFILKTFLILHSKDIKFKVTNFSSTNAKEFESEWGKIRDTIHIAFDLLKTFGFTESTLTSKNAIIPIVYYLYHSGNHSGFATSKKYSSNRNIINKWLHVVLVKQVFGGQADTVLIKIRKAIEENASNKNFPFHEIVDALKGSTKDMRLDDEFLENLLYTQKDDRYAFSILALLYPNMDYKNGNFHKDHIHPYSWFTADKLEEHGILDEDQTVYLNSKFNNSILNLQMLDANENMSKQDMALTEWITSVSGEKSYICKSRLIPEDYLEFSDFEKFISERKLILRDRFSELLTVPDP
jgi:uncharacterized protein with ParB-like and HNH nuclease domain